MRNGMLGQSGAGKQSRGKLCKGEAFMNTPFTVWKRPHTLPKGQVKGATPRPPARAASQVRLGVWGLAPAKRQPNCNANSMHPKKRGYGGATPCTGKILTKLDANQQFLHFSLDVKYSIFSSFRLPFQTASRQPRRSGVDARRFFICVPYLSGINARPTAAGGLVCADAAEGWAIVFSGCLWKIKAA